MHTSSSSALPGARPHPSVHGGIVVLRPALDAVPDATADDADEVVGTVPPSEIRAALLELFEIGPPVVSPHDEANPTWVEEHSDSTVELLELSEALSRVDASERAALVAEHIGVLAELCAHYRTVAGAGPHHGAGADQWCPLCIADPDSHAASLRHAIVWRTGELMDAIALYGAELLGGNTEAIGELLRGVYES